MSIGKKQTRSKVPVKAVMIYMPINEAERMKKFADDRAISSSKVAREGIYMRMDRDGDKFEQGFNEGLNTAITVVRETKGAQMMFPSGKSFAQLVCDGLEPLIRPVKHE
jgi:hypothetical protein